MKFTQIYNTGVLYFNCRLHKVIKDIIKYLQNTEKGPWSQSRVSALDRALGEINRILDKKVCYNVRFTITHLCLTTPV